jgi:tetratricopeptide (TPR) repeat protein
MIVICFSEGRFGQGGAIELYGQSLSIRQKVDDKQGMPLTLKNLAKLYQGLGDLDSAGDDCQQALALTIELGIPLAVECEALQLKIQNEQLKIATEESRT